MQRQQIDQLMRDIHSTERRFWAALIIAAFAAMWAFSAFGGTTLHQFTAKTSPAAADEVYINSAADSYAERRTTIAQFLTSQTLTNCTLTNPLMTTPTLGDATADHVNGLVMQSSGGLGSPATLTIAGNKSVLISNTMTLAAGADNRSFTFPSTSATIARTDAAQTFTGTQTFSGTIAGAAITADSLAATGAVTSSSVSSGIGYATGAGSSVTQVTSSSTGVTINNVCGRITTVALTTAAGAEEVFTVSNSRVAATDIVNVGTTYDGAGTPAVTVKAIGASTFKIVITNLHATDALNTTLSINFAVIKGVTS